MKGFNLTNDQIKEGMEWYFSLNDYCKNLAYIYKVNPIKVAGILSALSPMVSFRTNLAFTEAFLKGDYKAVKTFNQQKTKAYKILKYAKSTKDVLRILNGNKTKSFFLNIAFPDKSKEVTIDTHINKYFKFKSLTPKRYALASKHIQDMAKSYNILPHQVQALLWIEIRGKAF
jgi:hypothetical protein